MTRTGDRRAWAALALAVAAAPASALADVEFYQTVDRTEVGTDDTFRVTVVVSEAPEGSQVQFPASNDFEQLSRSQSTQMSYSLGGGGSGVIQRVQKWVLVLRANRAGNLTLPPAVLVTPNHTYKTEALKLTVKPGRVSDPNAARAQRPPNPFQGFPGFGFPEDTDEPRAGMPEPEIPRSDSDLFLKAYLDKEELYVGEQATLSLYVFSRLDLSSVDALTMPKLEGFWSEDLDSPSQLVGEQRLVGGVPYRAFLLKRRVLFPVRAGALTVQPAEAEITTGFLFAGRRLHRKGNAVEVKVKPLPPGGPANATSVGRWRLSEEVSQTQVNLGEPITVKVALEGQGNLKTVVLPPLTAPPALKVYDPTTTDKATSSRGVMGGRRLQEYLVMPQQTGTFTVPGLVFDYFDSETGRYESPRTDTFSVTVLPGANGVSATASGPRFPAALEDPAQKNKLELTGLRPLRYQARFQSPEVPLWTRPFFLPVAAGAPAAFLGALLLGMARTALTTEDAAKKKRKQARAARARLAAAEKLKAAGRPDQFYGEVEKALLGFLDAKLGQPVAGLTRDRLMEVMAAAGVSEDRRRSIAAALEVCEMGRYAPGGGNAARGQALDQAAAAMEGWDAR